MNLNFLKQRWQRVTARIVLVLAALILLAGFFINLYFSPILGKTVKSTVLSASDSLYKIDFANADLHILRGTIVIFNIDVQPNMAVYNKLKQRGLHPNNLYRLHIKKLVLTHIHPFTLYFKRRLDIGEIVLSAPELNINYQQNRLKDTVPADNRTLYQRIAKTLKSIHVGRVGLNDVQFKYEDHSGHKVAISELKELNLSATDLLIDSASMTDKSRFLYCRDVVSELNNFTGTTPNGLYKYRMKLLTLSTRTSQVNGEDINLEPVSPEKFFSKTTRDRFSLHVDSLQLNDFDFLSYHKYRKLSASSLILTNGRLGIFSNPYLKQLNKEFATGDRSVTFPNAGIYKLNTDLKIDSILLKHINVGYTELNAKSQKTGYVFFNNTNATILNLSTNAQALQKNKYCDIALNTLFMNKGKLDVGFRFDMAGKDLAYSYKGHLGPINLNVINSGLMTLAMVKINAGKLKSFDFDIKANRNKSQGRVTLLYNDLKVTLLKPDTVKNKMKRMMIESFFANAMIIKHNNPDNDREAPRSYYVNEARPIEYPFFKTVWKTLLTGIRQGVGYGDKKEQEIKTQMAERKVEKAERKIKKAERKEKRAERKREKELKKQLKEAKPEEEEK